MKVLELTAQFALLHRFNAVPELSPILLKSNYHKDKHDQWMFFFVLGPESNPVRYFGIQPQAQWVGVINTHSTRNS